MAGIGGSGPLAVGGGVLSDLFSAEERGRALGIYSLAPLLGPALGPIAGGFIAEYVSWRWIFYATTIADAEIQLGGLLFLRETYTPVLLSRRCRLRVKETGDTALHTEFDKPGETVRQTLKIALFRPFSLVFHADYRTGPGTLLDVPLWAPISRAQQLSAPMGTGLWRKSRYCWAELHLSWLRFVPRVTIMLALPGPYLRQSEKAI